MLILCPECGRQVSDKAPYCPHCGIEIAANGQKPETIVETIEEEPVVAVPLYEEPATPQPENENLQSQTKRKKRGHGTFIASFLIASVLCAAFLYYYKSVTDCKATEEQANMAQIDSMKTQPQETVASVQEEPQDVAEEQDVETAEAETEAEEATTETENEASNEQEAHETTDKKAQSVSPEEQQKSLRALRKFFQAINAKDREAVVNTMSPVLTSFNGKAAATKADVFQYITDLYQADVKNMNWHLGEVQSIKKTEINEGRYEYEMKLTAMKETHRADSTTSHHQFNVSATISPDGKVSAVDIKRK